MALGLLLGTVGSLMPTGTGHAHGVGARRGVEPDTQCRPTLVGVAHQDDDLLFMGTEVQRLVRARCFAGTVYLTAGDAGRPFNGDDSYILRREQGLRSAYARMAGVPNHWRRADLTVRGRDLVSFVLNGRPDIRLVFLRLPDGFSKGAGSPQYAQQSLLKLFRGQIATMRPVDGTRSYTHAQLTSVLTSVLTLRNAERVLTQDYDSATFGVGPPHPADHSDHEMTGRIFRSAAFASPARPAVTPYVGYGLPLLPPNLTARQQSDKKAAYYAYAAHAGCVALPCSSRFTLSRSFRLWMEREHRRVHRQPRPGEIMSAIGRTAARTAVERCLARSVGQATDHTVTTEDCDGSHGQRWTFDGATVRAAGTHACLTAAPRLGLASCDGSDDQTWWRDADGRIGSGTRCLHQDDLAELAPRLSVQPCGPYRPQVRWLW
ncbi:ricin-type beta-trefoil lectin domain protein [Streptomyces sp. NPDC057686]|uniref:ricin-type beta-trefoil lectin domain protein n=1 Tax=Streptomyces sp. NPDC057686 TaxID=3346212 RepID=UPI0036771A14